MTFTEDDLARALGEMPMDFTGDELAQAQRVEGSPETIGGGQSDPMDIVMQVAEAPPTPSFVDMMGGPRDPGPLQQLAPSMSGQSDVTAQLRRDSVEEPGGFDWARGLLSAGRGDVAAYDANRRARDEAPLKRLAASNQIQEMNDATTDRARARKLATDALDPRSPTSNDARSFFQSKAAAYAKIPGMGSLSNEVQRMINDSAGMNASQIARMDANLDKIIPNVAKFAFQSENMDLKRKSVDATERSARALEGDRRADNALQRDKFAYEQDRDAANRDAKLKAARLKLQTKGVDKKAVEELQNIEAMDSQFQDVEKALPKAMTGPGTDTALAIEGAANSSIGKALGADKVFDAVAPAGSKDALAATRTVRSGIEQSIAEMKLKRHGASFTASEQKVVDKWAPGVKLGEEDNKILLGALRKYMGARGQERIQQVYKETGMPIYLPPDAKMSLEDVKRLKAIYEGIDKYDDDVVSGTAGEVNKIVSKYGGRVSAGGTSGPAKPDAAQVERARKASAAGNAKATKWLEDNGYAN